MVAGGTSRFPQTPSTGPLSRTGGCAAASSAELEREQRHLRAPPEDEPEVEAGRDLADLVPDAAREERRLRVVEDDRLLLVEPARLLVDLRPHRPQAERADLVLELALAAVEDLALPGDELQDLRRGEGDTRPGRDEHPPVRVAVADLARGALAEELLELALGHAQQVVEIGRHRRPLGPNGRANVPRRRFARQDGSESPRRR